jgi:hypothetical protein
MLGLGNRALLVLAIFGAAGAAVAACSSDDSGVADNSGATTGSGATGGTGGAAASGSGGLAGQSSGPYPDFPADPEIEPGLPADIGSQFSGGAPQPSGGPCLSEPSLEALVPSNWTPLRFEWSAADQNVFELRLAVDNQVNDLVVYTTESSYTVPDAIWNGLTQHSAGHDIVLTLRGAKLENGALTAGPFVGAQGPLHIAPVPAPGSVVYWTTGKPGTGATALNGFTIGDKSSSTVLTPSTTGDGTTCIGCHASAPDGNLTFFTRDVGPVRTVDARSVDGNATPPNSSQLSAVAAQLLARDKQTAPVLSAAHYSATDAVAISVFYDLTETAGRYELAWTDLHAADPASGWGILARNGDPRQVATPTWWHDGSTIAYTSSALAGEGVISAPDGSDPTMDVYVVPYNNRAGGTATPLPGASDPGYWEFYPVISPDDALLAFNRSLPVPGGDSYDEPNAEVFVVPAGGGTPVRLEGNDPPACTGKSSPGLTNSWPRWAPSAGSHGGKRYYWVVFSSKRREPGHPQLFVSGIVTATSGGIETIERAYPALYVTSQIGDEANHTPAWDVFKVAPPG